MNLYEALVASPDLAAQSMNTLVSAASDDIYVTRKADGRLVIYIHEMESEELQIFTSLQDATACLNYAILSLDFVPATRTGRDIIQFWLKETGQDWQ